MIRWIQTLFTYRRERNSRGEISTRKPVLSGVPQESVLSPILCLICVNDLDDGFSSKVLKFADDTKVFRTVKIDAVKRLDKTI